MSRSVHTTRQTLRRALRWDFAEQGEKQALVAAARSELWKKRVLKAQLSEEDQHRPESSGHFNPDIIPIRVRDEGPYVHHGATPADLRAIMHLLPAQAVDGLSEIKLELGRQPMKKAAWPGRHTPDPWVGRYSTEMLPGVWVGPLLGTYSYPRGLIRLYAFVVSRQRHRLPARHRRFFLRLEVLRTFVHEVAHHHDEVFRRRRGRWLKLRTGLVESYAEQCEHQWMHQIVVPFLETAYPRESAEFLAWIREIGGLDVPLAFFAGDERTMQRDGRRIHRHTIRDAFCCWLDGLTESRNPDRARLLLASELSVAGAYPEALAIIDQVPAASPEHPSAHSLRTELLARVSEPAL